MKRVLLSGPSVFSTYYTLGVYDINIITVTIIILLNSTYRVGSHVDHYVYEQNNLLFV